MSLNKARKRLIRKYRKMYNSRPIGLKFSTDGGETFIAMGNIVEECIADARNINSENVNASKLSTGEISFRNFEITLKSYIPKEEFNRLKGVLW